MKSKLSKRLLGAILLTILVLSMFDLTTLGALAMETPEGNPVIIEETQPPLAAVSATWAVVNLILTVFTVLISIILLIVCVDKKKRNKEDVKHVDDEDDTTMLNGFVKVSSTLIAILAILVFIFTEDMSLPVVIVDQWTIVMILILLAQMIVAFVFKKSNKNNEEKDEELA